MSLLENESFAAETIDVECMNHQMRLAVHCDIERKLFQRHEENPLLEMLCNRLLPGDVVYDVGAHAGYHSLWIASQLTSGQVFAFEPNPHCVQYFQENLRLNPELPALCIPAAVSNVSGWADLSHGDAYEPSARLGKGDAPQKSMVATISLDDFAQVRPAPNAMKIDVEGAEGLVLQGAGNVLIDPTLRCVMLELHPTMIPGGEAESQEILTTLSDAGFRKTHEEPRRQQIHLLFER